MNFFDQVGAANTAILAAFGESITLAGNTVNAVVELSPAGYDVGGGMLLDKTDPSITLLTADYDMITVIKGDAATVRGTSYKVTAIHPDDNGMTMIMLRPI